MSASPPSGDGPAPDRRGPGLGPAVSAGATAVVQASCVLLVGDPVGGGQAGQPGAPAPGARGRRPPMRPGARRPAARPAVASISSGRFALSRAGSRPLRRARPTRRGARRPFRIGVSAAYRGPSGSGVHGRRPSAPRRRSAATSAAEDRHRGLAGVHRVRGGGRVPSGQSLLLVTTDGARRPRPAR